MAVLPQLSKPLICASNPYSLTVTISGSGNVGKKPDQATYTAGSVVQLTATPSAGYLFSGWSGGAGGTQNPLSVTMNSNLSITATFTLTTSYSLSMSTSGSGTVVKQPDQTTYTAGSVVQLTATPSIGYLFSVGAAI